MSNLAIKPEQAATLLCDLEACIRDRVLAMRNADTHRELAGISHVTAADTIYAVDKISEAVIIAWFTAHWPAEYPVELVMEGAEDGPPLTFPAGTPPAETQLKCILDPIDGTRSLMFDKRSAWALAGLAPQRGDANTLCDIEVAVMTELPISRQTLSDQVTAIKGHGISATRVDLISGTATPVTYHPSPATEVSHAFGTVSRFFPAGMALLAQVEETFWQKVGASAGGTPVVFNDQYITSGGQLYELMTGHDRFIADLRPLAFAKLGIEQNLVCHPYDMATELAAREAGCVIEQPDGSPLAAPLDTTSPVSWVGYANEQLAVKLRPILQETIAELL